MCLCKDAGETSAWTPAFLRLSISACMTMRRRRRGPWKGRFFGCTYVHRGPFLGYLETPAGCKGQLQCDDESGCFGLPGNRNKARMNVVFTNFLPFCNLYSSSCPPTTCLGCIINPFNPAPSRLIRFELWPPPSSKVRLLNTVVAVVTTVAVVVVVVAAALHKVVFCPSRPSLSMSQLGFGPDF